ncbi:MAG: Hsp20/alpha crystallin family protein [Euryarchaeota archaeon]|nr:Hsp20/alpha crystallin family protein [Euryarchaeota archaeon]MBU4339365.1 Hsp20/alpha crystallin family protein [Euryarchaeota archaeon]MBU4453489.1 Hsp20/alpha crystallin family protein [Euryarchaeota archaeon]MCG2737219.1 Hsp20/alpha crystallin family protein [Candidatus Methanoperedenaceae archaeon]
MYKDWRKTEKGFFDEFEREFEQMNELMNRMMTSLGKEPQVYGFSIQAGPEGLPHVERFGNVVPVGKDSDVREPFTSSIINEKDNEVNITAEMPGIGKEDIEVNATENDITIKAESSGRKYYKKLSTPAPVDPDSAKAKYNNGVLEVTLRLKEQPGKKGKKIDIE